MGGSFCPYFPNKSFSADWSVGYENVNPACFRTVDLTYWPSRTSLLFLPSASFISGEGAGIQCGRLKTEAIVFPIFSMCWGLGATTLMGPLMCSLLMAKVMARVTSVMWTQETHWLPEPTVPPVNSL